MDLEFDLKNLPWPDDSTSLFCEGMPSPTVATIPTHGGDLSWHRYASGYLEAANQLVAFIKAEKIMGDFLVYPTVFLFRHYTELRLKELIVSISRLNGDSEKIRFEHDLEKLWNQCRPLIESVEPPPEDRDIRNVGRLILELADHDPRSTDSRYPDNPVRFAGLSFLDLDHLQKGMEELAGFLDACSQMVSVYLESNEW